MEWAAPRVKTICLPQKYVGGRADMMKLSCITKKSWPFVVIVEGVLDTILLDQLGVPAVAPFGGGGVWRPEWTKWFGKVKAILIVADNDDVGLGMAKKKRAMLGRGTVTLPPAGTKDIGEGYLAGVELSGWITHALEESR